LVGSKALQEFVIWKLIVLPGRGQLADVPQDGANLCAAHGIASREDDSILLLIEARGGGMEGSLMDLFHPQDRQGALVGDQIDLTGRGVPHGYLPYLCACRPRRRHGQGCAAPWTCSPSIPTLAQAPRL